MYYDWVALRSCNEVESGALPGTESAIADSFKSPDLKIICINSTTTRIVNDTGSVITNLRANILL